MKHLMAFIFTLNSAFLNGSISRAQEVEVAPSTPESSDVVQLFKNLEAIKKNIRFLDSQNQSISIDVAILNLTEGQRIYIVSAVASPTALRIQKVPNQSNGNYSASLLVEQMLGNKIADVTRFDLNIDSEAVPYIYRKLLGEPASQKKSSTELHKAEVGEYYHRGQDFTISCGSTVEVGSGNQVKVVGLRIGPGGVGNIFVLLLPLGILFLLNSRPTRLKFIIAALIPIVLFSISGALKHVAHQTGCRGLNESR